MGLIEFRDVITPLHGGIECDHIPNVHVNAMRGCPVGDALHLFAILGFDMRPEHGLACFPQKIPVLAGVVSELELVYVFEILNFGSEQVAVLETYFSRSAFQVHDCPPIYRWATE